VRVQFPDQPPAPTTIQPAPTTTVTFPTEPEVDQIDALLTGQAIAEPEGDRLDALLAGELDTVGAATRAVRNLISGAAGAIGTGLRGEARTGLFAGALDLHLGGLANLLLPEDTDENLAAGASRLAERFDRIAADLAVPGGFLTQDVAQGLGSLAGFPLVLQMLNQEGFEAAKRRGLSDEAATALGHGTMVVGGAAELFGLSKIIKAARILPAIARMDDPITRRGMVLALTLFEAAGAEAGTETFQTALTEGIAEFDGSLTSARIVAKRALRAGAVGGVVGGLVGGAGGTTLTAVEGLHTAFNPATREQEEINDIVRQAIAEELRDMGVEPGETLVEQQAALDQVANLLEGKPVDEEAFNESVVARGIEQPVVKEQPHPADTAHASAPITPEQAASIRDTGFDPQEFDELTVQPVPRRPERSRSTRSRTSPSSTRLKTTCRWTRPARASTTSRSRIARSG
jgi:hypothetical protein